MRSALLALAFSAAAAGIQPAAAQPQGAAATLQSGETLLEVQSLGETWGVPDRASFTVAVDTPGTTPAAAMEANAGASARLAAAAATAGVQAAALRTSDLSVRPRYRHDRDGNDTEEVIGYRATSRFSLHEMPLPVAEKAVAALIEAGATEVDGPNFAFADAAPLVRASRADAIRKAQQQAQDYAAALNLRVVRVLRVSERSASGGEGQEIVVTGAVRRSKVLPVLAPGEQSIMTRVWIDFALAPR
ncbi:SIMPL domain-containing protein [Sphingomonas sp. PL-96]|uniref:SIMPL domain-containing protein n=1 Tax=Sphingomonas sp. PL-96 TaxID=2887201 RepID=UPI001E4C0775|nr:SIMPL domain-containing protein [Sphingomonas sp. PL-96]MCC2976192.1 SIMPL domain-containing protein [Sphingomonas sp. PL-96]